MPVRISKRGPSVGPTSFSNDKTPWFLGQKVQQQQQQQHGEEV